MRYGEVGVAEGDRTIKTVSSGGMFTIIGLSTKTEYTVEVAAETSAGIGVYSPQTSSNSEYTYTFQEMMGNRCILILFRCISQSEWCHYS